MVATLSESAKLCYPWKGAESCRHVAVVEVAVAMMRRCGGEPDP